jgi:hypothetical protein
MVLVPITGDGYLAEKVRRLEQDLETALSLLRALSHKMQDALGREAIGPELSRFLCAFDFSEQQSLIARLDALAANGDESGVARFIRDLTGVSWDQVFTIYSAWQHYSADEKEKWVRSVQLRRVLRPGDSATVG